MKVKQACLVCLVVADMLWFTKTEAQFSFHAGIMAGIGDQSMVDPHQGSLNLEGYVGLLTEFKINKLFAIQPSVEYAWKNYAAEFQAFNLKINVNNQNLHLNYFVTNLPLKFNFFRGWYVAAGPQFGILVHAEYPGSNIKDFHPKNDLHKCDYGILAGIGYQFKSGFALNINMERGLRPVGTDAYRAGTHGLNLNGENYLLTGGFYCLINYD